MTEGGYRVVYHRAECPGLLRQKARVDATLGGTLSSGSHTGIFLRKAEAEISVWRQWFF